MFGWMKRNPEKQLRKQYHAKLEEALHAQRNGNIRQYSFLTAEAEKLREKLEEIEGKQA